MMKKEKQINVSNKGTPILWSDLKKELQEDWLKDIPRVIANQVKSGKKDLIIGRYNDGYHVSDYGEVIEWNVNGVQMKQKTTKIIVLGVKKKE